MKVSNKPPKLKIVLLGNRAVGKSSIIRRFILDDFAENLQPTIGVDYMSKTVKVDGTECRLELWDTAGQQKYRSLVRGYLKGAHACIYVYDCTNINSYMGLGQWINLFQSTNMSTDVSLTAGNKWDLCREEDLEALEKTKQIFKASEKSVSKFEEVFCSAKSSHNINDLFITIAKKILSRELKGDSESAKTLLGHMKQGLEKVHCCEK